MTSITRVTTYATFLNTVKDYSKVQSDLSTLQQQISSGQKASSFGGLQGQVESFVSIETKLVRYEKYTEQASLVISRLGTMDKALENVLAIHEELDNLIAARNNGGTGHDVLAAQQAEAMLQKLAGELNTSAEGRYLFAGSKSNERAVKDPIEPGPPGTFDDAYYMGDNVNLKMRASDSMELTYGVRANEQGFQKLIGALNTLAYGDDKDNAQEFIERAGQLAEEAGDEIRAIRARVQTNLVILQDVRDTNDSLGVYWKNLMADLNSTDIAEASTKVAIDQSILQASFLAFSRISQLKLSDYL